MLSPRVTTEHFTILSLKIRIFCCLETSIDWFQCSKVVNNRSGRDLVLFLELWASYYDLDEVSIFSWNIPVYYFTTQGKVEQEKSNLSDNSSLPLTQTLKSIRWRKTFFFLREISRLDSTKKNFSKLCFCFFSTILLFQSRLSTSG